VDFGGLKAIKRQLEDWFDHTVILQADDPLVHTFRELTTKGHCKLQTFPLISCEGLAEYVGEYVDYMLHEANGGRNWVVSCEMIEAEKNSAIYTIQREDSDRMLWHELQDLNKQMEEEAGKIEFKDL
jgi:6-pyruvoyltetrahydropterin/6-carboxytetrahydropterin synthase